MGVEGSGRRGPAGQQVERLGRAAAGLGAVDADVQPVVGRQLHDLVAELEIADDGVVQPLDAGLVVADVVRGPPGAELRAAGGQLPDEVRQAAVIGVAAGLGAQVRDEVARGALPVGVEVVRRRVQEGEAGAVGRLLAALEHRRVERAAERVGRDVVDPAVAHDRRRGHRVDDALHDRPHPLRGGAPAPGRHRTGGAGEVVEMGALRLVELQRAGERLEHAVGDAGGVAALQPPVVLDADAGQRSDLLAAQALARGGRRRWAARPAPA